MDKTSETVRLNRFLAMLGAGSRRACDDMIFDGRVKIGGRTVKDPSTQVIPGVHRISLDNSPLESPPRPLILMLNKPTGVVSTTDDPEGRPTILDFCKRFAKSRRLFPVGRLDVNTTGLILLTNDGMLCYRLTHPRFEIPRTYQVRVRGSVTDKKLAALERFASSASLPKKRRPSVKFVNEQGRESILRITLYEGRNRQVRNMCTKVALTVVKLRRIQFGPLSIRKLPLGAVRPLEKRELDALRKLLG